MEDLTPEEQSYYCGECQATVKGYHRFCHNCGGYLGIEGEQVDIFNNRNLRSAFLFYSLYFFICIAVKYTDYFDSYDRLFWIEILLAAITSYFAWLNWKSIRPLLSFKSFNLLLLITVIVGAALFSWIVDLSVRELNVSLFHSDVSFYRSYKIYIAPQFVMIYSIALMPAIFEELAFRGVLYNSLAGVLDEKLVVLVTGFIFAVMHLNPISLVWLIPFGILLGFFRRKYNTLWYGIIFHFVFNLVACLLDLYKEGALF